jgi:hypothetical protein
MVSDDLAKAQEVIETILTNELKLPLKNFTLIKKYLAVLQDIDNKRRLSWNEEKFGVYEELDTDDIPF